jgi:hypothetical protein
MVAIGNYAVNARSLRYVFAGTDARKMSHGLPTLALQGFDSAK